MAKTPKRPGWRGSGPPRPPGGGRSGGTGGGDKPRGGGGGGHDDRDARDDAELIRLLTEISGKLGGDRSSPGSQPTPPRGPETPGSSALPGSAPSPTPGTTPPAVPDLVRELQAGLQHSLHEVTKGIVSATGFGSQAPASPPLTPLPAAVREVEPTTPAADFPAPPPAKPTAPSAAGDRGVIDTIRSMLGELREAGRTALSSVLGGITGRPPTPPAVQPPFAAPEVSSGGSSPEAPSFGGERPATAGVEAPVHREVPYGRGVTPPPVQVTWNPSVPPPPVQLQPWFPPGVRPTVLQQPAQPAAPSRPRPATSTWSNLAARTDVPQVITGADAARAENARVAEGRHWLHQTADRLSETPAPATAGATEPPSLPGAPAGIPTPPPSPFTPSGRAAVAPTAGRGDDLVARIQEAVRSLSGAMPVPSGLGDALRQSGFGGPAVAPSLGGEGGRASALPFDRMVQAMEELTDELRRSREDRGGSGGRPSAAPSPASRGSGPWTRAGATPAQTPFPSGGRSAGGQAGAGIPWGAIFKALKG
jgi:hypothetical protein